MKLIMGGMQGRGDPPIGRSAARDRLALAIASHVVDATPGLGLNGSDAASQVLWWRKATAPLRATCAMLVEMRGGVRRD